MSEHFQIIIALRIFLIELEHGHIPQMCRIHEVDCKSTHLRFSHRNNSGGILALYSFEDKEVAPLQDDKVCKPRPLPQSCLWNQNEATINVQI